MKKTMSRLGFTLIELLIVITIIGILAVVFLPTVLNAPAKSRDAARQVDVGKMIEVIESLRLEGKTVKHTSGTIKSSDCADTALSAYKTSFPNSILPIDPQSGNAKLGTCGTDGRYTLEIYDSGAAYGVFARVENGKGNVDCVTIKGGAAAAAPTIVTTNDKGCYGAISQ